MASFSKSVKKDTDQPYLFEAQRIVNSLIRVFDSSLSSVSASPRTTASKFACVCFDLDGTLWDTMATLRQAHVLLFEKYPHLTMTESQRWESIQALQTQFPHQKHDWSFLRKQLFKQLNPSDTSNSILDAQWEFWLKCRNTPVFFPGVVGMLERLRRQYPKLRLGAVTDGNADVRRIPKLAQMFDFSIRAEEVGCAKPDPAVFAAAIKASGIHPRDTLFVGDSFEKDIAGAKRAGMAVGWVTSSENNNLTNNELEFEPDFIGQSVVDILDRVMPNIRDGHVDSGSNGQSDSSMDVPAGPAPSERLLWWELNQSDRLAPEQARLLPVCISGKVAKGYQRGRQIGTPTANIDPAEARVYSEGTKRVVSADVLPNGVYYGFATVGHASSKGAVYKAAMSVGFNPFFGNDKKTVEPFLFDYPTRKDLDGKDEETLIEFYGAELRIVIAGYLHKMGEFAGKFDELIQSIEDDKRVSRARLDHPKNACLAKMSFLDQNHPIEESNRE